MSDRVVLSNMRFDGRHGVLEFEKTDRQPFEIDVELVLDLRPAGLSDDVSLTADYRAAFDICRSVIEGPSRDLIETLAEEIATRLLAEYEPVAIEEAVVRVRKPEVALPGRLDWSGVEIRRRV
jgi:7,8-dihydroneopterin aldolase/epimerase/oxygenase